MTAMADASGRWVAADRTRICWFIQTSGDRAPLERTLARLRQLYAESQVLVVSDGDPVPAIARACAAHGAAYALGERLFGVEHGGAPVQRMLDRFLTTDADILIKIDPDTDVRWRFTTMPDPSEAAVYGTVQSAGTAGERSLVSIQGGCIIVPRRAAEQLASSALLLSDRLEPPAIVWAVSAYSRARAAAGLTSYDWTLGWACRELGLPSRDHPEVFSRYRANLFDLLSFRRAAVVHPRFEWAQVLDPIFYVPRRWSARILPRGYRRPP
jgi:hypothetical protein